MRTFFTGKDLEQLKKRGISRELVDRQLEQFRRGFPFADIRRPAVPGDGIFTIPEHEKNRLIDLYKQKKNSYNIGKFVPASGAASRMFKNLFAWVEK